jgi:hypothetical protein
MSDLPIRPVTIAEHAILSARRTVETGECVPNPHDEGSDAYRKWEVCFKRALQMQTAPEGSEGCA